MDEARLETLVAKAIEEHSEVFPSSRHIAESLRNYNLKIHATALLKKLDIRPFQLNWINTCPEGIFLENFNKKRLTRLDGKYKEAVEKRFQKIVETELKNNPEIFPDGPQIAKLLRRHKVNISKNTIAMYLDLNTLQINWINSCPEITFIENFGKHKYKKLNKEGAKKRFEGIVKKELQNTPDVFPTSLQIAKMFSRYEVKISSGSVRDNLDLPRFQIEWLETCNDKTFLENLNAGRFVSLDEEVQELVDAKFNEIVKRKLEENPDIFPGGRQTSELLKDLIKTGKTTMQRKLDLSSLQLEWIQTCSNKSFLKAFNEGRLVSADKKIKRLIKHKIDKIVKEELKQNPEIFPGSPEIVDLLYKSYDVRLSTHTIAKKIDLKSLQSEWVRSSAEELFLNALSSHKFSNRFTHADVRNAVDRRMYNILVSNITNLGALSITKETTENYLKKFPDLAFLLTATQEHKFTIDQRIVLDMHVWRETRSEHLHKLIGARLDQLWGFRELFALMKDGRCLDADVISMFHESLPERIGNYIPESAVTHSFVDNLRAGAFKAGKGKDVLLLSFMHWLADKQSAEIMLRLNQSVGTDNAIYMTSPNGLEYAENLIASMNTFGFVPEKVGSLYLLPPNESEGGEQKKLLTKGKILQFRKMQDVEKAPEELQLFSKERRKKGGERVEPKADIISYDEKNLEKSSPLITMKDVGVIFTEKQPKVKKVEVEGDKAILGLEGGAVLGFHVDPRHPNSIEIEGRKIPKGTDNAILDVMKGKEGFEVSKGLKNKYKKFMKLIKDKREQIKAVKKTKLRRK